MFHAIREACLRYYFMKLNVFQCNVLFPLTIVTFFKISVSSFTFNNNIWKLLWCVEIELIFSCRLSCNLKTAWSIFQIKFYEYYNNEVFGYFRPPTEMSENLPKVFLHRFICYLPRYKNEINQKLWTWCRANVDNVLCQKIYRKPNANFIIFSFFSSAEKWGRFVSRFRVSCCYEFFEGNQKIIWLTSLAISFERFNIWGQVAFLAPTIIVYKIITSFNNYLFTAIDFSIYKTIFTSEISLLVK